MSDKGLENLLKINKIEYSKNEAMSLHTSFKIGGEADLFITPENAEQLKLVLGYVKKEDLPYFVIGNGSNLLVSDKGIEGAVIGTCKMNRIELVGEDMIYAEAGASLMAVCVFARKHSLSGLEFAYGIPASVGGALFMNAGAYGGEMSQVVCTAESIDNFGNIVNRKNEELELGYRRSIYRDKDETITSVVFKLKKGNAEEISAAMELYMGKRKASQPLDFPSAGSTFKRPEGYYAAALIDECGLKGRSVGKARVSEKHAGFVINGGGATCDDVLGLIDVIKETVKTEKGVDLHTEVIFTGRK